MDEKIKNTGSMIGVGTAIGAAGFAISAVLTYKIPKGFRS